MKRLLKFLLSTLFFLISFTGLNVLAADSVSYSTHVENIGWQNYFSDGQTAGTTGKALQIEAIKILVNNGSDEVEYSTHVENIGWTAPVKNDNISGTTGKCLQIEAINIKLNGSIAQRCDIYYRTHVADVGWLGWAKNGENAGTAGGAKQMEAIEIVLLPKGNMAPGSTNNAFIDFKNQNSRPSQSGPLKVVGNKLTNQAGIPVQLRGVSTHGLAWFPEYVNQQLFYELHNNWNANVVRLALYTAEYNGYCTGGDQNALKGLVKAGIEFASNADMYVIVDWHVLNDQNPMTYKEQAKQYFNEISSQYKNNSNIIYEICNEPNGGVDWNTIKNYALEVIPVIRANDPDAVIIVGTPTWSQDVDQAVLNPITEYNNIMYAFHFYAATHKDDLRNKLINATNAGLPIFVSEFGVCDASGNGNLDLDSANIWINTLNSNNISYVCWSLCNKPESASLINSNCKKINGFGTEDLTTGGQWLITTLSSPGLPGSSTPTNPVPNTPSTQPTTPSGNLDHSLKLVNEWTSGNSSFYQYDITITNNTSTDISSWEKTIQANQNIKVNNYWNCKIRINDNSLIISNENYNGSLNPGESTTIGLILESNPNLILN